MEVLHYQGSFQTPLKGFETQASMPSTVTKYLLGMNLLSVRVWGTDSQQERKLVPQEGRRGRRWPLSGSLKDCQATLLLLCYFISLLSVFPPN